MLEMTVISMELVILLSFILCKSEEIAIINMLNAEQSRTKFKKKERR